MQYPDDAEQGINYDAALMISGQSGRPVAWPQGRRGFVHLPPEAIGADDRRDQEGGPALRFDQGHAPTAEDDGG